jgi:formylglycine-generating enzyme required for sulfatase activity
MKTFYIFLASLLFVTSNSVANNIAVSNASLTGQNTTAHTEIINFDVAWENSWRTSTNESNYDGAWVFIKFRKQGTQDWRHCTINTAGFVAGTGSTIKIPTDSKGAFIYRTANGIGNVSYAGNQLVWNYGADGILDNETVEIRVFAVEMVYIPTGSFYLGSGGTESYGFSNGTGSAPYLVADASAITTGAATGMLNFNGNGSGSQIPVTFPTGYNAFWIMKYEATQQQYADFLNHLDQARAAILNSSPLSVTGTHPNFTAVAPERAVSQIGFKFNAALADWSGLRPYSELEFEKVCRGYNTPPLPNEYVWGTTLITPLVTVTNSGLTNETVTTPANANANVQNGILAISRAGIFARTTGSTRELSGGSYYGVMNMGDNVEETIIFSGNVTGRAISATVNGDGYLGNDAYTDIAAWQDYRAFGIRGASFVSSVIYARTSERNNVAFFSSYPNDNFANGHGSRLARTAP